MYLYLLIKLIKVSLSYVTFKYVQLDQILAFNIMEKIVFSLPRVMIEWLRKK